MGKIVDWLNAPRQRTTIQGCMIAAGGGVYGYLTGDWRIGGAAIAMGVVGVVMNETPAQVAAQIAELAAEFRQVRRDVVTTAAVVSDATSAAVATNEAVDTAMTELRQAASSQTVTGRS